MATATKKPKVKKEKKPKPDPAIPLDVLQEYLDREGQLEDEVREHEGRIEELRQEFKSEKELKAGKLSELRRLIWERNHPEAAPMLFHATPMSNGHANSQNGQPQAPAVKGNGQPTVAGPVEGDESWRAVPLREALPKLGKKVYDGFDAKNLKTLGEFCDWRNKDGGSNWVTDLPGVGKAAADKIDDAVEVFFGEWRKKATPAALNKANDQAKGESTQNGKATMERVAATNALLLAELPLIKERGPILGGLHLAGLRTIGDVFALADQEKASIIDALRTKNLPIDHAGIVDEAIKTAIKQADNDPWLPRRLAHAG
jgi:hypothetical protein